MWCLSVLGVVLYGGMLLMGGFSIGFVVAGLLITGQGAEEAARCRPRRRPWEG
jgi:hypothetical protein